MKIMASSFKGSHTGPSTLSAPNLIAGHQWPTPLLETPDPSWASLGQSLVGSLLFLLGPGTQGFVCALQDSISQSCVSSGSSMVGLMVTSAKRAYAILRSAAPRAPAPAAGHCWPIPPQETLKHGSVSVSLGSLGPGGHGLFEPSECLWKLCSLILNVISPLLPSCWGFFFAPGHGVSPQSHSSTAQPLLQLNYQCIFKIPRRGTG